MAYRRFRENIVKSAAAAGALARVRVYGTGLHRRALPVLHNLYLIKTPVIERLL
jgi:hypothetical protein